MKKWLQAILLIIVMASLGACSESTAKDLSAYPESVQNGEISVKFYDNYMELSKTIDEYSDKAIEVRKDRDEATDENYKNVIDEYNKYLRSIKLSPSTKVDREINDLLREILDIRIEINSITLKYSATDNKDEEGSVNESLDAALTKEKEKKMNLSEIFERHGFR